MEDRALKIVFHVFLAAAEQFRRHQAGYQPQTKHDANGLIWILPNLLVRAAGAESCLFFSGAKSCLQQFLAVMNNGFQVLHELIDIDAMSIFSFILHALRIGPPLPNENRVLYQTLAPFGPREWQQNQT